MLVELSEDILDEVKCTVCHHYISSGPVWAYSDGTNICGNCSPSTNNGPKVRNLLYEKIFAKVKFPCRFKANGCPEEIIFNDNSVHEASCRFKTLLCPSSPHSKCQWEGYVSNFYLHFRETHKHLILINTCTFELNLKTSESKVFISLVDKKPFIIEYEYYAEEMILSYYVATLLQEKITYEYQLKIIDNSVLEKVNDDNTKPCFYYMLPCSRLYSSCNLLSYLNKQTISVNILINEKRISETQQSLDYEMLAKVQCFKCGIYATPPFYFNGIKLICSVCNIAHNYRTRNCEVEDLASILNYPCKWKNCGFVCGASDIQNHELSCKFRLYNCPIHCTRKFFYVLDDLVIHLKINHNCIYFTDNRIEGKIDGVAKYLLIKFNNEVFVVYFKYWPEHEWEVYSSCKKGFQTTIHFKHDHCNIKSRVFNLAEKSSFPTHDLPPCYRDAGDITYVLTVNTTS